MNNNKIEYGEVIIDGRLISNSWWGQMWCKNIENYSNLRNRLERGRTYIRKNTIKSISISKNYIESLVQGTQKDPYNVLIKIKTIPKENYNNILRVCENSIDNLESLMSGAFPKEYQELFTDENYGLFPKSDEIEYSCSCLDYLSNNHMCKHIAATLYAVGNKLDKEPLIFFKLRGIELDEFTNNIIKKENEYVWEKINIKSDRTIDRSDIKLLFGIDYDDNDDELDIHKILNIDKTESKLIPEKEKNNGGEHLKQEEVFEMNDFVNILKKQSEEINKQIESSNQDNKDKYFDNVSDYTNENLTTENKEIVKFAQKNKYIEKVAEKNDNKLQKKSSNKNIFSKLFKWFNF